ncbi:major facilitator superfamily transporter [Naviculisporaceae sp. PSN 640]
MTYQLKAPGAEPAPTRSASHGSSVTPTPSAETVSASRHELKLLSSSTPSSSKSTTTSIKEFCKEWGLWLAIVSSIICPFVDESIIATAIPAISSDFKAVADVGWYGSAYLMTMSAFQLIFGRLYREFPAKVIFMTSLLLFESGSLICALSPTSRAFIFGRALAGVGAAGLYSGVVALFVVTLPKKKLPAYLGAMGTLYGFCSVLGPMIGGVITDNEKLGWRWCFWINLPVAIPPLVVTWFFVAAIPSASLKEGEAQRSMWARLAGLDYLGMVLLIPGISCLLVAVDYGGLHGWNDRRTIGCFVATGVLVPLFALSQWWRGERALLPPRIVRDRLVFSCCVFTSCVESSYMTIVYYMPFWFQNVQGVSAAESGVRYLAICIPYCVVEIICGLLVSRFGYVQPFMLVGSVLLAVAGGLLSTLEILSGPQMWAAYLIVAGLGVGAATDMPSSAVQRLMNEDDAPLGFATILFCQNLGPTMAVIVANSILLQNLRSGVSQEFGGQLDAGAILASGEAGLRDMVTEEQLPKLLEIYNHSLTRVFIIVIVAAAASVFAIAGVGTRKLPDHDACQVTDESDPEKGAETQTEELSGTSSEEEIVRQEYLSGKRLPCVPNIER